MTVLPEKPSSVSPAAVTSLSLGRCALPVANVWLTEEVWSLPRESECRLSNPDSSSVLEAPVLQGGVRVGGSHSLIMLTRSVPGEWSRDLRISSLHQPLVSLVTWADSLSLFFPMTPKAGLVTLEAVCADCLRCTFGFLSWHLAHGRRNGNYMSVPIRGRLAISHLLRLLGDSQFD